MSPVVILPFLLLSSYSDEHSLSSLSLSWFSCFFNSSRSTVVSHTDRAPYWHWYEKSFSLWHSGSPSLVAQSDGPLSPSDIHPSSNPKQLMLSGVSLLAVSNVNNPVGLVCLPFVMWSANFFVTHIQTEKISSWNGPTVHVCCFMLARASTKTFVSRIHIR